MKDTLVTGLYGTQSLVVDETLIVPAVSPVFTGFADMPPVFATAFMVGLVEWTCVELLRPHLEKHEHSVGTGIAMTHTSPTPAGLTVIARIRLAAIHGRMLTFSVSCADALGEIGAGTHERAVIDRPRFMRRVSDRALQARAQSRGGA